MKINHIITGKGPCVVLLHGFMGDLHIWDELGTQLSEYFKVVQIDLPGHGETPVVGEVHSMEFMAQCVNAVLEAYQIDDCVLVGHSMGGYVAAAFAKLYSKKVRGLCFFHSNALADTEEAKKNRERAIALILNNKLNFVATFISELFTPENQKKYQSEIATLIEAAQKMDPQGIAAAQRGMKERNGSLDLLATIDVPVLFIIGKQDPRMSLDKMMAQAVLPKHSEVLLLDDVGHMGFIEAKQKTFDVVETFSDRCFSY